MNQLMLLADLASPMPWSFGQIMGMSLWVGLAVLTIALLILARTRWGQAKPLGKCVALSLFAHVLLGGYAYGTKLIFTIPVASEPEAAPLKMVELDPPEDFEIEPEETQPVEPWNQFSPVEMTADPAPHVDRHEGQTLAASQPTGFDSQPVENPGEVPDLSSPSASPRAEPDLNHVPAVLASSAIAASALHKPEVRQPQEPVADVETWQPELPKVDRPTVDVELPSIDNTLPNVDRVTLQEVFDAPDSQESELVSGIDQLLESTAFELPRTELDHSTPEALIPQRQPIDSLQQAQVEQAANQAQNIRELLQATPIRRRLGDGQQMPELYQLRDSRHRSALVLPLGGTLETEQAVQKALAWLASVQESDGRWDASRFGAGDDTQVHGQARQAAGAEADTGITALAVLAFLAADHTHLEGEYQQTVQRALEFLLGSQGADGNLAGNAEFFAKMYCHGMATLALSESLAITGDPRLRSSVEAAVRYTLQAQHPQTGGWRYQPRDLGDMSQFGWQVMALRSAEQAGFSIPESCRLGMHRFLESASSGTHGGLCSYRAGEQPTATMTAEGLACRFFLGFGHDEPTVAEATQKIMQGESEHSSLNLYYIYYATIAMYQRGGSEWDQWNEEMQQALLKAQRSDNGYDGSWDPDTRWGGYGGRVYSTAMAALSLEVYYRYLPLYRLSEPMSTRRAQPREAAVRIPGDVIR